MRLPNILNIAGSLMLLTTPALAQEWVLVEDFSSIDSWIPLNDDFLCEGEDPEACLRVQELVTDPVTGSGMVGMFRAAPLNQTTNWGAVALRDISPPVGPEYNGLFTVYFEFAIEDFRQDTVFGTHTGNTTFEGFTKFGGYTAGLRVNTNTGGLLEVRDEQEAGYIAPSSEPLEANTWYQVWLVHKNNNDFSDPEALSVDVYLQGGSGWPEQTLYYEGAWYRDVTGAVNSFAVIQTTGNSDAPNGNAAFYLRNLQIDYGAALGTGPDGPNLTAPGGSAEPTWAGYPLVDGWAQTEHLGWVFPLEGTEWLWNIAFNKYIYSVETASNGTTGAYFYLPKSAASPGGDGQLWANYPVIDGWADTGAGFGGWLYVGTDAANYPDWVYSQSLQRSVILPEAEALQAGGSWVYRRK